MKLRSRQGDGAMEQEQDIFIEEDAEIEKTSTDLYVHKMLVDAYNHYGPDIKESNLSFDDLCFNITHHVLYDILNKMKVKYINVMCTDEKIRSVKLVDEMILKLALARDKFKNEYATKEFYENVLTRKETGEKYVVINNKIVHPSNKYLKLVAEYVMEHDLIDAIYYICTGRYGLSNLGFAPIETMDAYIKGGARLRKMKHMIEFDSNTEIDSKLKSEKLCEFNYIRKKIESSMKYAEAYKHFVFYGRAKDCIRSDTNINATGYKIIATSDRHAECTYERDTYGLVCEKKSVKVDSYNGTSVHMNGTQRMLINYISYLDAQEKGTKPDFLIEVDT